MCKEYNGWSNYETWLVKLWIDNDQDLYNTVQELAQEIKDEAPTSRQVIQWHRTELEAAENMLADQLKEMIEEDNPPEDGASLYTDLMRSALSDVNWHEIAENILGDLEEE